MTDEDILVFYSLLSLLNAGTNCEQKRTVKRAGNFIFRNFGPR